MHDQVVAASGVQWDPIVPALPAGYTGEVRHSVTYRSADELNRHAGCWSSGPATRAATFACDAARSADHAVLSVGRGYWFVPKHVFGAPSDVFAEGGPALPMWLQQRLFGVLLAGAVRLPTKA